MQHIIARSIFEVKLGSQVDTAFLETTISNFFKQEITPLLIKICNEFDDADEQYFIPKIDINLGNISLDAFNGVGLSNQIAAIFHRRLADFFEEVKNRSIGLINKKTIDLENLWLYLTSGRMPWWTKTIASIYVSDIVRECLKNDPRIIADFIKKLFNHPPAITRLIESCTDEILIELIECINKDSIKLFYTVNKLFPMVFSIGISGIINNRRFRIYFWSYVFRLNFNSQYSPKLVQDFISYITINLEYKYPLFEKKLYSLKQAKINNFAKSAVKYTLNNQKQEMSEFELLMYFRDIWVTLKNNYKLIEDFTSYEFIIFYNKAISEIQKIVRSMQNRIANYTSIKKIYYQIVLLQEKLREELIKINTLFKSHLKPNIDLFKVITAYFGQSSNELRSYITTELEKNNTDLFKIIAAYFRQSKNEPRSYMATELEENSTDLIKVIATYFEQSPSELRSYIATELEKNWNSFKKYIQLPPGQTIEQYTNILRTDNELSKDFQLYFLDKILNQTFFSKIKKDRFLNESKITNSNAMRKKSILKKILPLKKLSQILSDVSIQVEQLKSSDFHIKKISTTSLLGEFADEEAMYIENAGIILIWPFLKNLFSTLNYINSKNKFINKSKQKRAIYLLNYIVKNTVYAEEHELLINKILCGLKMEETLNPTFRIKAEEKKQCQLMFESILTNWPGLGKFSIFSFQQTFLLRSGVIKQRDGCWLLQIEKQAQDVLLEKLPWPIGAIKLPWMNRALIVQW